MMSPAREATTPSSTSPRPGLPGASVARRAFRQIRSHRIRLVLAGGLPPGTIMSIHIASHEPVSSEPVRDDAVSAPPREPGLWFRTALLPGGWAESVRIQTSDGRISVVESGVAALPGDERAAVGLP